MQIRPLPEEQKEHVQEKRGTLGLGLKMPSVLSQASRKYQPKQLKP